MKTLLIVLILSAAVILPQQLRQVVTKSYSPLSCTYFIDENNGWSSGESESVYKTTDGGISWELCHQNPDFTRSFYAVQFINANIGYAGGGTSSVVILKKSTDGGDSWFDLSAPGSSPIKAINFINESTGWILGSSADSARIWKTVDGGANWVSVMHNPAGDMEDMYILPNGKGVAVGGGVGKVDLYYTTDGDTWTKAAAPSLGGFTYSRADIRSVYMVDDNLVYTSGWGSYIGLQPSIFLKSTNGGQTWTYLTQTPENRVYVNVNAIYFKDAVNGVAFGGDSYNGTVCVRTTDAGLNWIPIETSFGFSADGCYGMGDKVWVVGNGGAVGYTSDFGNTWKMFTPIIGTTLEDINIIGDTVFAGGYNGIFYRSTNKGIDWTSNFCAVGRICPTINDLHFINSQTGFAARNNKLVSKTIDGGLTWSKIMQDSFATGMINNGIYFFDENKGFVVGRISSADYIYKTENGGLSWSSVNSIANEYLTDVEFADANTGAATGNDSKILFTTNAGTSWQVSAFTDLPAGLEVDISALTFSSATTGVAVGEKCVFTTADGGATWKYIVVPNLAKTLRGVAFKDENEGWAVGDKLILHTQNGGKDWTNVSDTVVTGTSLFTSAAVDKDGYLWITGSSNIFTYAPFVDVRDENNIPQDFQLSQNYPNPFNPSTTIRYTIASESRINLRVYDILGNLVNELYNGTKPAGEYTVSFNAENLPSGIYFYVMNAGGKLYTRKMTLIK